MRKFTFRATMAALMLAAAAGAAFAQERRQTYTGTIVSYGTGRNIRTTTNTFTLIINGTTADDEVNRLVGRLQEGGQDELMKAIDDNDLGSFAVGGRVGRRLNVVRVEQVGDRTRIRALFERWIQFGELRGGYRSVDYPFSYLELFIDPNTGRGDGTLIEAAQIRWKRDGDSNQYAVEIENFATYPARLMGVNRRGR